MRVILTILIIILSTACVQQQNKTKSNQKETAMNTNKTEQNNYLNQSRPGYYLQVNNQNCHYRLLVNDLDGGKYFDKYPIYSVRIPLNLRILKSGDQKISLSIFPYQGNTLSKKANLQVRLMMYPDMTDIENDFGGSTTLMEWKMPDIGEQELPFIKFDTIFKAEVPYEITTLDKRAVDLSEIDKEELLVKVVKEFTNIRKKIINKTQDINALNKAISRTSIQVYTSTKQDKEVIDGMINVGDGKEPQPLENFEMHLYYNNRVVTLVKRDDKEPAIWFKNLETGARSWQPVYLYKDVTTGKWMRW